MNTELLPIDKSNFTMQAQKPFPVYSETLLNQTSFHKNFGLQESFLRYLARSQALNLSKNAADMT